MSINKKVFLFSFFYLVSTSSQALVDYSSSEEDIVFRPQINNTLRPPVKQQVAPVKIQKKIRTVNPEPPNYAAKWIEFKTSYRTTKLETQDNAKFNALYLEGHVRPLSNIFLDFSYWQAKSDYNLVQQKDKYQQGNLKFVLGFNWISLGEMENQTRLDLYGGAVLKNNKSEFATTRDDKIIGLETSKRFSTVLVALGGEVRLTGRPHNSEELEIGNIMKIGLGLGWIVSSDIRIGIEASNYKILKSKRQGAINPLTRDLTFSSVSPFIYLGIIPGSIEAYLGMHIRTRRVQMDQELLDAKLYDYPGAYGSTLLFGLNFSV